MELIPFDVSAKTARLIGRENISGVNGALLELVKNAYDADASCCLVVFDMPFPSLLPSFEYDFVRGLLSDEDLILFEKNYTLNNGKYSLNQTLIEEDSSALLEVFSNYNRIIVADNGSGMSRDTIRNSWMNIGTNEKEVHYTSAKGRIKTGAKGIGRFALDKLSSQSVVYTKSADDSLYRWAINWNLFERAKRLSEISAELSLLDSSFYDVLEKEIGKDAATLIGDYQFSTGTIIVLHPTRETWRGRLFSTLNSNLSGINPFDSKDKFDVYVRNFYYPKYDFKPEPLTIQKKDYDYFVESSYDGNDCVEIKIIRNELNVSAKELDCSIRGRDGNFTVNTNDYWNGPKLTGMHITRENYSTPVVIKKKPTDLLKDDTLNDFKQIGPFKFRFYFYKVTNGGIEIAKKIVNKRRKELSSSYSGIKIYRDNFKVRPYGEIDADFFDWLHLGSRSQKSPAPVTHPTGAWRVEPYQVTGSLEIGRFQNPLIKDMANREGIEPNYTYTLLVELIQKIIEVFENDRQFFLREFFQLKERSISRISIADLVINTLKEENGNELNDSDGNRTEKNKNDRSSSGFFTREDYKEATQKLIRENNRLDDSVRTLMLLATMGVVTNTFAHEIAALRTGYYTGPSQIKLTIPQFVKEGEYHGDPDFDPYRAIADLQITDDMLSKWILVLTKAVKKDTLTVKKLRLISPIIDNVDLWRPLLAAEQTSIIVLPSKDFELEATFSVADIFVILNNFILNSRTFFETGRPKEIYIDLLQDGDYAIIELENTGKPLNGIYEGNPYTIFDLNVSEKTKRPNKEGDDVPRAGTGIGLWMVRRIAEEAGGEVYFHKRKYGNFGFAVKIPIK